MSRRLATLVFLLALALRVVAMTLVGTGDVAAYLRWGHDVRVRGLAKAYTGIYFPLQWQVFAACDALVQWTGLPGRIVLKMPTLAAELAIVLLLAALLRRQRCSPAWALLFWAHPTYVLMSALGYVDAQFAALVLLSGLLADRARSASGFLLAGLPLGVAFLMKPQAIALVAVVGLYACITLLRYGRRTELALVLAPLALFVAYSVLLWAGGRSPWALTLSYLEITDVMPALTANQLNLWAPVSWIVAPRRPLYWVADTSPVLGPLAPRHLAAVAALALLAVCSVMVARRSREAPGGAQPGAFTMLYAFASFVLPMVMTNAHENHLYLGGVYLVLLLPLAARPVQAAVHLLLLLCGANLLGIYAARFREVASVLVEAKTLRTPPAVAAAAEVATLCFVLVAAFELRLAGAGLRGDDRLARTPRYAADWRVTAALGAVVLLLQATVVLGWR